MSRDYNIIKKFMLLIFWVAILFIVSYSNKISIEMQIVCMLISFLGITITALID